MKTGQMLFVAFGGIMLGAAGTLAIQSGLVHYEVTLDIRPRGSVTLPPPTLSSTAGDPYSGPPIAQNWEPAGLAQENIPVALPPLDDQQIAEIASLREQIGHSQKLNSLIGSAETSAGPSFAEHLRAAAGGDKSPDIQPAETECPLDQCPAEAAGSFFARGHRDADLR